MLPITFEWREISSVTACVHRSWFYDDGKVCTDWFAELGWVKKSLQQDSFPSAKTQFNQQLTNPSSGQQEGGCKCWGGAIWLMDKNVYSWHKCTEIHRLISFPILSTNTNSSLVLNGPRLFSFLLLKLESWHSFWHLFTKGWDIIWWEGSCHSFLALLKYQPSVAGVSCVDSVMHVYLWILEIISGNKAFCRCSCTAPEMRFDGSKRK